MATMLKFLIETMLKVEEGNLRNLRNLGNLGNLRKEEDYKQFINIIHFYGLHLSNANF